MKKAFGWSITIIGIVCLIFFAGVLTGRNSASLPLTIPENTAATKMAKEYTDELININTADKELLTTLPGIGEVLAERIIAYREENGPFQSISQLRNVDGIGTGKVDAIFELICTED